MLILITASLASIKESYVIAELDKILHSGGHSIIVESPNGREASDKYSTPLDPDLIIAINRDGLAKAKIIAGDRVPIVYLFCYSQLLKEFQDDISLWERMVVIEDFDVTSKKIFPASLTHFLQLPRHRSGFSCSPVRNEQRKVAILNVIGPVDLINLIYSIASLTNTLNQISFELIGFDDNLTTLFGENVTFNKTINDCPHLVIASDENAERAIFSNVPCIVLGNRGFGGLIGASNLELLAQVKFSGRPGGELGESIPNEFLIRTVSEVLEMTKSQCDDHCEAVREQLKRYYENASEQFNNFLANVKAKHYHGIEKMTLSYSPYYTMVSNNDSVKFHNKITKRQYKVIGHEEFSILQSFVQGHTVNDVFKAVSSPAVRNDLTEFLNELVKDKILIEKL